MPKDGFIWLAASPTEVLEVIPQIQTLTGSPILENHIDDCLNPLHPSFYDTTHAYDILIFRALLQHSPHNDIETQPLVFFMFSQILVTFSDQDQASERLKKRLETSRKPLPSDPMNLAFSLLDEVVDNFLALRTPLLNTFNHWEQQLFAQHSKTLDWMKFLDFKAEVRKLRTLTEDQLEVIYQWRQDNEIGLSELLGVRFNDLTDHIRRVIRYTTQLEADLDTLIELYYSLIGNRTNEVVKVLTVLSAIFLPLNLIAGIFGMNFTHMSIFNMPYGQHIALLGMAGLGVGLFFFFKWKQWI